MTETKAIILFTLFWGAIISSIFLMGIGYHNVDLSHNFILVGERYDTSFIDTTLGGNTLTMKEGYLLGHRLMAYGFALMLVTAASNLLINMFTYFIYRRGKK